MNILEAVLARKKTLPADTCPYCKGRKTHRDFCLNTRPPVVWVVTCIPCKRTFITGRSN